jgi:hypothetical protein
MLIRSRFSFHYRDDQSSGSRAFRTFPSANFYLSNIKGNCFFYASQLVECGVIKLADRAPKEVRPIGCGLNGCTCKRSGDDRQRGQEPGLNRSQSQPKGVQKGSSPHGDRAAAAA